MAYRSHNLETNVPRRSFCSWAVDCFLLVLERGPPTSSEPCWVVLACLRKRDGNFAGTMCWALGSRRSLFGWLVLCSVGASRRCYLGMRDSHHLLFSQSGSNWCNMAPTCVKPSVTDFTQV